jgi:hypothetical protein
MGLPEGKHLWAVPQNVSGALREEGVEVMCKPLTTQQLRDIVDGLPPLPPNA